MSTMTATGRSLIDGRFRIERVAASGGMGTVYRAYDTTTGAHVALKVLSESGDEWRFALETRIARFIEHPFAVQYVAHGHTIEGAPYLALEWLDGEDLASRLLRGRLTIAESLQIVRRVARALSALHDSEIVHRDLKPANVFLCDGRSDRAKLLDFGIARVIRRSMFEESTVVGTIVGTPQYMAPEQAKAAAIDVRTDVYALGTLLFECLTGTHPFAARNFAAVLVRILKEPAPRLADRGLVVPGELEAFCARMLEKDPDKRPTNAREVCEFIERFMSGEGIAPCVQPSIRPTLRLLVNDSVSPAAPTGVESCSSTA